MMRIELAIGDHVEHCMGHVGVVVAIEPLMVIVRFVNTTSRVWASDLRRV